MIPKGKLLALLLAFTAVGGLAATGAFTTVQAERTAEVNVDGDANALLQITPVPDPDNSDFISENNTGSETFQISLDDNVNARASTSAEDLVNITNNGEEPVDVWIATEGGIQATNDTINTTFYIDDSNVGSSAQLAKDGDSPRALSSDIDTYTAFVDPGDVTVSEVEDGENDLQPGKASAVSLAPGDTMTVSFAVEIEKGVPSNTDILNDVTIFAVNDDAQSGVTVDQELTSNSSAETGE
jgi:hypothetical protein